MCLKVSIYKIFQKIISKIDHHRESDIHNKIDKFLNKSDKILDLGCGLGSISSNLLNKSFNVISVDITDNCVYDNVKPTIYDGHKLPFKDKTFDKLLLITVLHHTPYPESILKEAIRVSKNVIIMEDLYDNNFQKYMTFIMDSLSNLEFFNHPHTNKSKKEWLQIFDKLHMKVKVVSTSKFWGIFESGTFYLETN
jgi:ubiquinone/menaquinone biosynthesis C-methylase UbiE